MKLTFKSLVAAAAVVALFFSTAKAQDSKAWRLGIGANVGLPTEDAYSVTLGGDLRLQKDFSSNVSGTLTAGYTSFQYKSDIADVIGENGFGMIPVKAGIKFFPVERFYLSGELGAAFATESGAGTSFVYAPGIGVGTNSGWDFGLRYEGFSNNGSIGHVALRVAYAFNLSN